MNKINDKKIDNYKKIICNYWEIKNCKYMYNSEKCSFAHGFDDLRKKRCDSYGYCWDEDCYLKFLHPEDWNPYNNKIECSLCLNPEKKCNKENKRYKHIDNILEEKVIINNIQKIPKDDEFPELFKSKYDNNEYKYKYSDVLTSNIKNMLKIDKSDNLNNINELHVEKQIISIKNKLYDKYKKLSKIDKEDWSNSIEIEEIEKEIEELKLKYNEIKFLIKEEYNIFNEENSDLNILFNNIYDENIEEIYKLPNIEMVINVTNIDKIKDDESVLQINTSNENEIKTLIENLEKEAKIYCKKIKKNINNNIKDSYTKFLLISKLNEILSMIKLLKINYEDLTNY